MNELLPLRMLLLLFLFAVASPDSNGQTEAVNAADFHEANLQPFEGVAMATIDGSRVEFDVAGVLQKDGPPVDEDTLFEIGSITKVFTGTLLAMLVQEGKANFDDPISSHLPESVLPADSPLASVTLLDLATHTSGLPRLPDDLAEGTEDLADPYAHYSEERLHEYLKNFTESDFEDPGEVSYSNLGMGLLGNILEHISGLPYEKLLAERILEPLGMDSTFVQRNDGDIPEAELHRYSTGHSLGKPVSHWHIDGLAAAGAIVSSVRDLAAFARAHWDSSTPPGIAKAMKSAMTLRRGDIGLAWFEKDGGRWHNGGTGGFRSDLSVNPEKETAKIQLVNSAAPPVKTGAAGDFSAISGYWSGVLDTDSTELRQLMRISDSGQIVLHSLDQAMRGIPSGESSFDGKTLKTTFPGIGGNFEGTLEGEELRGVFSQTYAPLPMKLKKVKELPEKLTAFLKKQIMGDVSKVSGYWSGFIGGEGGLYVILQFEQIGETGEARIFSPDQTPGAIPVTKLTIEGENLSLESDAVKASYETRIDGKTMDGTWNQGVPLPLKLEWSESRPERD